jgi:hypothetical protein
MFARANHNGAERLLLLSSDNPAHGFDTRRFLPLSLAVRTSNIRLPRAFPEAQRVDRHGNNGTK